MRQWNRILAAITAVLLLCMLGGGIALGVNGLPPTAPGPVYAAVHWILWAVLFVGSRSAWCGCAAPVSGTISGGCGDCSSEPPAPPPVCS